MSEREPNVSTTLDARAWERILARYREPSCARSIFELIITVVPLVLLWILMWKLVPVGPPNRYEEVASHPNVILWACRPCVDARGLALPSLDHRVKLGGMNEFHAAAKQSDSKVVAF